MFRVTYLQVRDLVPAAPLTPAAADVKHGDVSREIAKGYCAAGHRQSIA